MKAHHEATVILADGTRLFVMGRTIEDFPTTDGKTTFKDAKGRIHIIPCQNIVRIQIEPTSEGEQPKRLAKRIPRPKVSFTEETEL